MADFQPRLLQGIMDESPFLGSGVVEEPTQIEGLRPHGYVEPDQRVVEPTLTAGDDDPGAEAAQYAMSAQKEKAGEFSRSEDVRRRAEQEIAGENEERLWGMIGQKYREQRRRQGGFSYFRDQE